MKILILISYLTSISFWFQIPQETKKIYCLIETSLGDIEVELYPEKAPETVKNFMRYVDNQLYDSSSFFRVTTPENEADREIKIEVIQGGDLDENRMFDPIDIETTAQTGIRHEHGTLSMARMGPNTATSHFFICIGDQPELDFNGKRNPDGYGFAAFGKTIKGMDVARKIQACKEEGQYLIEPVMIYSIKRIDP